MSMKMLKISVNDLAGIALNWLVAKCEGVFDESWPATAANDFGFHYSTNWAQGGPIIDRERISLADVGEHGWCATFKYGKFNHLQRVGETMLIAGMRCYVASKLGDEVEVPEILLDAMNNVAEAVPEKTVVADPVLNLQCSCCRSETKGRQWHNRDAGYGLCNKCVAFVSAREDVQSMLRNYGIKGVHYYVSMEYSEIKLAAEQAKSVEELHKVAVEADQLYLADILKMTDENWREFTVVVKEMNSKLFTLSDQAA